MIELEPTVRTLPQGANRRQAFRIEVTCAIDAFSERPVAGTDAWNVESDRRGRSLRTVSEDVSISGVRMRLPAPLRAGTTLTLKIHIDDDPIEVVASVAHSRADQFGGFAGMQFVMIDPQARARLARFIAAEERKRLPNVQVMYTGHCGARGDSELQECSTQECTPGFVQVFVRKPIKPATSVELDLSIVGSRIVLEGAVVCCIAAGDMWRLGVHLTADHREPVMTTWRHLLIDLRKGTR